MHSPRPTRAIRRRSASRSRISPLADQGRARSRACAIAMPDTKQLPDFMHRRRGPQAWQTAAPHLREPGRHGRGGAAARLVSSTCRRPAGIDHRPRRSISLHRDWIEDMRQGDRPGVRAPRAGGQELRGRRLCRGAAPHGPSAGASSTTGCIPTTRSWCRPSPCRRSRSSEVDETLADPGLSDAAGQLSRPVQPRHAVAATRAACRSASRSSASRSAERDVLRLGKAFQDATDFHRRAPDLSSARPLS